MPNQAAKTTGWMLTDDPSGTAPKVTHVASLNSSGSPSEKPSMSGGTGITFERGMPQKSSGTTTTNPPSGPPIAMSKSARRVGNASRILMTAPIVPDSEGNG